MRDKTFWGSIGPTGPTHLWTKEYAGFYRSACGLHRHHKKLVKRKKTDENMCGNCRRALAS